MKLISAVFLVLLSACSSQPQVSYYQLPAAEFAASAKTDTVHTLFIEPVQVASYLNGRGLVLQVSAVELVMARQHLWAEPLDQQLQRQLRRNLPLLAPAYAAQLQASAGSVRLALQIDHFHGVYDGYALISGRFSLSNRPHAEHFELRVALTEDGYPALVAALGKGVQQLSQQLALQLQKSS